MRPKIKAIPNHPLYFITEYGDIYTTNGWPKTEYKYPTKLSTHLAKGYKQVSIQGKRYSVHRLVAQAFLGGDQPYPVNHKDGNKENNYVLNLEYCTAEYNTWHAHRTGLMKWEKLDEETANLIERHIALEDVTLYEISKIFNLRLSTVKNFKKRLDKQFKICQSV